MAKRASEHQITRDDGSDDEDHEVKVGMVKADASTIAGRQIKGLPKRKGATPLATSATSSNSSSAAPSPRLAAFGGFGSAPAPAPAAESKPEAPRFAGFAGFGSTPAPAPAAKPAETPRFAGFAGLGAPKSDPPAPAAGDKPAFPVFGAPPPKSGTTPFGSTSTPFAPTSSPFAPTSSPFAPTSSPFGSTPKPESKLESKETTADTDAALKYWTSLRGLNHAFVENVKKSFEGDMFADLSAGFKQYQEFREKIVKEYEDSKTAKPVETKPAETKPTFSFGAAPSSTSTSSSPFTFGAPKPAASTSTESKLKPTVFGSSDAPLVTPAATPPVVPPSPKKPAPSSDTPIPEATPTPSPMPEASTTNFFEAAAKKIAEEKKDDKPKPAFTFGVGASASTFGFSTTTTKSDVKPFNFSTGNSTPFSGFGSTASSEAPSTTVTPGGTTTTKPFAFTTPLSTPGTPFAFGAGSPKGNTTTARPAGSVGFSFGASPPRKETPGFTFGAAPSGPTSAVATPKSETAPTTSDDDKDKPKDGESESKADEEPDTDKAQATGAGEENEDTLFSARARVLRFYNQAWVGVGIGQFKIKFDRETKKRRVLHRLEGTGRVVLNCGLFEEMNPVFESKGLMRFTATDDQGHPMLYRVKVKTEAEAELLTNSLKDAIEAYKADKA